jgi:hypothetical protein
VPILLLLWLDIPLENRTGEQIAADLPMLGTVGWVEGGSELVIGDASLPDVLAGAILRQAHPIVKLEPAGSPTPPDSAAGALPESDPRRDEADSNPPDMADPVRTAQPGDIAPTLPAVRALRKSLDGQDPSDPYVEDLLVRTVGRRPSGDSLATGDHLQLREALLAKLRRPDPEAPVIGAEPLDFRRSPEARLYAQAVAFQARINTDRMRRARLVAPADLRAALGREPTAEEVEAWAKTLYERNDTAIEVDELDQPAVDFHPESVPARALGPGRPGWTREIFEEHLRDATAATKPPHTSKALAANFRALDGTVGGVSGDHLSRLRRERFPD